MKVIILAGGFGSRLSEYTKTIPKPMVEIGGKPMLWHVMNLYTRYKQKNFLIALGYKGEVIKNYFSKIKENWNIELIDTGENTMTGGRLKRLKKFVGNETCMLTYGDGLANIDINTLLKFHKKHGKLVTVTAVHPPARFGAIKLDGDRVSNFKEKSKMEEGWINGGFFVIEPGFFDYIKDDHTYLEREPLELVAKKKELYAFRHDGFWQCMDTKRDKDYLEEIYKKGLAPWQK